MKVSPSIIATEILELKNMLPLLEKLDVDFIHLDIMDGVFVNNITFGPDIASEIIRSTSIPGDTHLMIQNPEKHLDRFIETGTEYITFHIESQGDKDRIIDRIKKRGKKAGITLNPDTPVLTIEPYLDRVDLVLIMTVNPGFYGQKFKNEMIEKLKLIKNIRESKGYDFLIEVDGGINKKTAPLVAPYVDVIVSGSFIFSGNNLNDSILFLKQL